MKILVLHSELGVLRGGGESFTRNLFKAFAARGHSVTAAFVANRHSRYPYPLPDSFTSVPIPGCWSRKFGQAALSAIGRHSPGRLRTDWDCFQAALCWRTIRWHNQRFRRRVVREFATRWHEFDAAYVNGNVELAAHISTYRPTLLMLPGPVTRDMELLLRKVPAVCAHDDAFLRMREFLGDHLLELPLGLDTDLFRPGPSSVRSALGWSDRDCVIGYVGRLTHVKGIDLLVDAYKRLVRIKQGARLLVIGSGEEETNIRRALTGENARQLVHIEPALSQDKLPEWYRALDIMVMPSRYETLSNALLEAMACGIPFVASNVGGNKKLGKAGGILFESESTSSLYHGILTLLDSPERRRSLGRACFLHARSQYSWVASAEQMEKILKSRLRVNGIPHDLPEHSSADGDSQTGGETALHASHDRTCAV